MEINQMLETTTNGTRIIRLEMVAREIEIGRRSEKVS
jgi:hypothetical protein